MLYVKHGVMMWCLKWRAMVAIIKAQSKMRGLVSPKRTDGVVNRPDVAKEMSTWKPTLRKAADPIGKVAAMLARLSLNNARLRWGNRKRKSPNYVKRNDNIQTKPHAKALGFLFFCCPREIIYVSLALLHKRQQLLIL